MTRYKIISSPSLMLHKWVLGENSLNKETQQLFHVIKIKATFNTTFYLRIIEDDRWCENLSNKKVEEELLSRLPKPTQCSMHETLTAGKPITDNVLYILLPFQTETVLNIIEAYESAVSDSTKPATSKKSQGGGNRKEVLRKHTTPTLLDEFSKAYRLWCVMFRYIHPEIGVTTGNGDPQLTL